MAAKKTKETRAIERVLVDAFPDHPQDYPPEAYRHNSVSIRIRIISERFQGLSRTEREKMVLPIIRTLPRGTQDDVTILLLLSPGEMDESLMNLEFEQPTPSQL